MSYGFSKYQTCKQELPASQQFKPHMNLSHSTCKSKSKKLIGKLHQKGVAVSQTLNLNEVKTNQDSSKVFMNKRNSLNDKSESHQEYVQKLTEQLVGTTKP